MGELKEYYRESNQPTPSRFKENSINIYNLLSKPEKEKVEYIPITKLKSGGVYFIFYKDESNWMRFSPVLCCELKDKRLMFGVNLNFLPLEIRANLFDYLIKTLNKNNGEPITKSPFNNITFDGIYKRLIRLGFEYALVEYNFERVERIAKIDFSILPDFLMSAHPKNIYDPSKLYQIWESKLKNRPERHNELITKLVSDFYDVTDQLVESSVSLKGHFQRLKRNQEKFK